MITVNPRDAQIVDVMCDLQRGIGCPRAQKNVKRELITITPAMASTTAVVVRSADSGGAALREQPPPTCDQSDRGPRNGL
jgi:hypothetical protein